MNKYTPTIGLEIHAELKTRTKMFCSSRNDTSETRPNVNVCPICMGHPGTLPVINMEAVRQVLRIGTAVGGELAEYTEFDRKNYFYPDIPKGYQISQYKHPLVKGGSILGVRLTRIHLEEDTAKSTHDKGEDSLVDFNRAGVPLMELVTEPDIHDAETASKFGKELQLLLWTLGASEANMEKGEMRVEANISISKKPGELGTKVEVKNINSFKAVEKAIQYEITRQTQMLDRGEEIKQETRGWDEVKEETFAQRAKEESHDYRYFPDPDLPKLDIGGIKDFDKEKLKMTLPELPWERRERYVAKLGLPIEVADLYTSDMEKGQYMDKVVNLISDKKLIKLASNYISSVVGVTKISAENFTKLIGMLSEEKVSTPATKKILKVLESDNRDPAVLAKEMGLLQNNSPEDMRLLIEKIISENAKAVSEYKSGKENSLQYLIGQAMKISRGTANPEAIKKIFEEVLKK